MVGMSSTLTPRAPLDDPTYIPEHPPVNGIIPEAVARWGPKSQLRWFRRFQPQLAAGQPWSQYYVHSMAQSHCTYG